LAFMAPEVARGRKGPNCAADVFSFGRLAFFTITSTKPCEGMSKDEITIMLDNKVLPELRWPESGLLISPCKKIVQKCVAWKPEARVSMNDIYQDLCLWPQKICKHHSRSFEKLIDGAGQARENPDTLLHAISQIQHVEQQTPVNAEGPSGSFRFPGLKETPHLTMQLCMLEATLGWNYFTPDSCCCEHHYLSQVIIPRVAQHLASKGCDKQHANDSVYTQCDKCGLVEATGDDDDQYEHVCMRQESDDEGNQAL